MEGVLCSCDRCAGVGRAILRFVGGGLLIPTRIRMNSNARLSGSFELERAT
jgi:hypothetical protein